MAKGERQAKPVHWVGSSLDDLKELSEVVRGVAGYALYLASLGERHVDAKILKGFGGAGVLEVKIDDAGNTYRTVYTVKLKSAVYVLHVFEKKSKQGISTPAKELKLLEARLKLAIQHHKEHYENG